MFAWIVFLGILIVTSNFLLSLFEIMYLSTTSKGSCLFLDFDDIVGDNSSKESILLEG